MPKKKRKVMTEEVRQFLNNKSQTYFDGRFNSGAFFIYLTVRPSTDGKRAPLTAINLQATGSPQQAPPTYIAKMWKLIKFRKNVIFSRNHTDVNPDDWTITKKTIRTTIHENFSKMKNLKVDRWALSLISPWKVFECHFWKNVGTLFLFPAYLTLVVRSGSTYLSMRPGYKH